MSSIQTPAFVLHADRLQANARVLNEVADAAGVTLLLALKAFSSPAAFPYMKAAGSCASSVHEAKLGLEHFGGEQHVFAAAFSADEMRQLLDLGIHHITLNSFAQLNQWRAVAAKHPHGAQVQVGLRINPEHSEGQVPLYDPCAPHSRLGILRKDFEGQSLEGITGLHCHNLCEQNADCFVRTLAAIEAKFGDLLDTMQWFNFGGGHHITRDDYDRELFITTFQAFHKRHPKLHCYIEPGEAHVLNAGTFVTTVLDVVDNAGPIAILDGSAACHTPDVIEMPYVPRAYLAKNWQGEVRPTCAERSTSDGAQTIRLTGPSCLAGDVFGDYAFPRLPAIGEHIYFEDMALYTIVKTNTFNGIRLPSIYICTAPGEFTLVRSFGYDDFRARL